MRHSLESLASSMCLICRNIRRYCSSATRNKFWKKMSNQISLQDVCVLMRNEQTSLSACAVASCIDKHSCTRTSAFTLFQARVSDANDI